MQHTSAAAATLGCRFLCLTLPDYASMHSLLFFVPLPCWVSLGSLPSLAEGWQLLSVLPVGTFFSPVIHLSLQAGL